MGDGRDVLRQIIGSFLTAPGDLYIKTWQLTKQERRPIHAHESVGAFVTHWLSHAQVCSVVRIELRPDGILGLHPATADQLFLVAAGSGQAFAAGDDPVQLAAGSAVLWHAGERHETRAGPDGLVAIVIEGEFLSQSLRQ